MLLILADLLSPQELQTARQLLRSARWDDGKDSAGTQARQAKNNQQLPRDSEAGRRIAAMVLAALERSALFLTATLPKRVFPPRVNRYGGEHNHYGDHVDSAVRQLADRHDRLRTDISCTVFLSPPDEYDGGELCIDDTFGPQRVKLPAGHAVIYPGTSVHQVRPVTRGYRMACFFWVESLVRSAEQRRLLYDMDMALLRLRQQHGESPETVALTGSYHNLLRMWADT
ncbi:Fe2+-dependent dioxygenase [Verminephrobacter eiseniae]|uniref:Fe2+-dependent dioxygenase n=1 Tax=Verminephrobacter eiseniae TaxID=364317 RepID=UPI0010E1E2D6|nr:Fe2+-dependent dioxygenase [Verminephrobacter eiseniae]KAB7565598.1 Fe2+-dependent dioxygenase [Verminephrobacter sp. Larva24]MCW5230884.1 Fe2+-dependent dioxygenase [Verminephrobacter eiseniae]MCW5292617.1 Fe2+-dependent dioxygenase [Verminephrobacter eiseniae]MCW8187640.1 Fe2+-dependent dioxygenase [Verminephrobacter eiseniae]MCW8225951.1 Fe2+-dependent dioxygenase [Verminephrobacter eiseniae]